MAASNATTQIADLEIPTIVVVGNIILQTLNTNAFVQSGIAIRDSQLDQFLQSTGKAVSPRFLGPLKDEEPNISTDDPNEKSIPKKITGGANTAVRQSLNQSWSVMDLAADLYGIDPVGAITSAISGYWDSVLTHRILASLLGVVGADQAADGPKDLGLDISSGTGAAAIFSPESFIDARATMGDRASDLNIIAVHSVVYANMQKQQLIDFIAPAGAQTTIPTYQGARVIVDDAITAEGEGADRKYYSFLFGRGAIALGVGSPKVPLEVVRDASSGNGGGEEIVHSRVEWIIHPQGYAYQLVPDNPTPTLAQLKTPANWKRVFERKRIPLAALISKG